MIRLFFVIVSVIIFTGCKETQKFSAPVFGNMADAKVTVLSDPDEVIPSGFGLSVSDSLLTLTGEVDGKLFHTYDRKTGKSLGHYVNKGQGPDDMIVPGTFYIDNNVIAVQDLYTHDVKKFDKDWKCISIEHLDLGKLDKFSPRVVLRMPDGKIFMEVFVEYYMPLGIRIKDGDRLGSVYTDLPVIVEDPMTEKPYYERKVHFSPDAKKMIAVSEEGLIIETFAIDDIEINLKGVKFYYPFVYDVEIETKGGINRFIYKNLNIKGFGAIASTDSRIVAVYNDSRDTEAFTDISVWDWNGNPIRRYHTDKILLTIALSPDNPDEIYALGSDKGGEVELLLINCPGLLD